MAGYLPGFSDPVPYTEKLLDQSGELAFDVGANAGWVATRLAARFARVVAFEPAFESYEILALNAQHVDNLDPVHMAVSDHTGDVALLETPITAKWGELVTGDSMPDWGEPLGARTVPCVTLDGCIERYGAPDLVKVDTEGHEALVMAGAETMLEEVRPAWWIEIHSVPNGDSIANLLLAHSYAVEMIHHPGYPSGSPEWLRHYYLIGLP